MSRLRLFGPARRDHTSRAVVTPQPTTHGASVFAPGHGGPSPAHGGMTPGAAFAALSATSAGGTVGPPPSAPPAFTASAQTARPGANVGSLAVTLPTYAAGDHVVILLCGDFLGGTDTATAAGWTQDGKQSSGNQIAFAFHRKMTGGEGASVTFTFNNSFERPFAIAATYSGASGLEASIAQGQNTPVSTWSLGPLVTTGGNRTTVALVYSFSGNPGTDFTTVNGGATKRIDVANATSPSGWAAAAIIADVTATPAGNYSMGGSLNATTNWLGVMIALIPS